MRSKHLAAIHHISQTLAMHLDLDELFREFACLLREHFSLDHVSVYRCTSQNRLELCALADSHPYSKAPDDFQLSESSALCEAFVRGQLSLRKNSREEIQLEGALHPGARLQLSLPFSRSQNRLGIINLESERVDALNVQDVAALEALADSLATSAHNAMLYAMVRRKARVLQTLNRLSQSINAEINLQNLFELIYHQITQLVPCEHFLIALKEKGSSILEVKCSYAEGCREAMPPPLAEDELASYCVKNHKPLLIQEEYDRVFEELCGFPPPRTALSWLGIPLLEGDHASGILVLWNFRQKHRYDPDDVEFLQNISDQAAIAIRNARLLQETEERATRLMVVNEITRAATLTLDLDELFQRMIIQLKRVIRFEKASLAIYRPESDSFLIRKVYTDEKSADWPTEREIPARETVMKIAWETRKPFYNSSVEDTNRSPSPYLVTQGIQSAASIPIVAGDVCLGTLNLGSQQVDGFSPEQIEFLATVANSLGTALNNAYLYSQLEKSYADLKETQEHLVRSEKLRALGEMSVGVAHDFNNMLAVILGKAQLLKARDQDPASLRGLEAIESAALEGASTVRRLQDFTQQRANQALGPVDILQLIEETLTITRSQWKDHAQRDGVKYSIEKELEPLPVVAGDVSDLREVFTIVLLNAFEAMVHGGTLKIGARLADSSKVEVSFVDTGIGMSEEIRQRVFDPFFTTKIGEGKGLGLSVAYGIITRHQGTIEVHSEVGQGTEVQICLPVYSGTAVPLLAPSSRAEAAQVPAHSPLAFLVVDDEPLIREVLEEILAGQGHHVFTAANGKTGLELFYSQHPDFVITDLGMPEMSGWEVAAAVKSAVPSTKVLLMTGWGSSLDEEKAKHSGVDRILAKPFQVAEFQGAIQEMLAVSG